MIRKPGQDATEGELLQFIHAWVKLCAAGKCAEAFSLLDQNIDGSRHVWTPEDIREVTFDHFDDGEYPSISDPDEVEGSIRKDAIEFDDGSGWSVMYDLPLNGVVSDFTLLFKIIRSNDGLKVILDDCHVL